RELPELLLVEDGDAVSFLAQPLDLHQLPARVAPRRLQRVGAAANDYCRLCRWVTVHECARPLRRARRDVAGLAQYARKGQMRTLQCPKHTRSKRDGGRAQRLDQLLRALVPLPSFADAAIDDLFQVIAAGEVANVARADSRSRRPLDQDPEE